MPQLTNRFREWAPEIMRRLIADFGFTPTQAAGVVGNGAHESGGFMQMQELSPTVKGSRGGLGVFQWTGPRRRSFEAWLERNKDKGWTAHTLDANYSMLFRELTGPERATIAAVKAARTLEEATHAFCKVFERPGIVHMGNRLWWARQALALFAANPPAEMVRPLPEVPMTPNAPSPKPWYLSKTVIGAVIAIVSPMLAKAIPGLAGIDPNAATQTVLQLLETLGPLLGGGLALVGRISTTQPIAGTQAERKVEERYTEAVLAPSPIQRELPPAAFPEPVAPPSLMDVPLTQLVRELPDLLEALAQLQRAGRPSDVART